MTNKLNIKKTALLICFLLTSTVFAKINAKNDSKEILEIGSIIKSNTVRNPTVKNPVRVK